MVLWVTSFRLWSRPGEEPEGRSLTSIGSTFSVVIRCEGRWAQWFGVRRVDGAGVGGS